MKKDLKAKIDRAGNVTDATKSVTNATAAVSVPGSENKRICYMSHDEIQSRTNSFNILR